MRVVLADELQGASGQPRPEPGIRGQAGDGARQLSRRIRDQQMAAADGAETGRADARGDDRQPAAERLQQLDPRSRAECQRRHQDIGRRVHGPQIRHEASQRHARHPRQRPQRRISPGLARERYLNRPARQPAYQRQNLVHQPSGRVRVGPVRQVADEEQTNRGNEATCRDCSRPCAGND